MHTKNGVRKPGTFQGSLQDLRLLARSTGGVLRLDGHITIHPQSLVYVDESGIVYCAASNGRFNKVIGIAEELPMKRVVRR